MTEISLAKMLEKHFHDDDERFAKILEQGIQNGGHLSYFNKNLMEVKEMLNEQNRVNKKQYEEMKPIKDNFEENTKALIWIKKRGVVVAYCVGFFVTLVGAWNIIKNFIHNL